MIRRICAVATYSLRQWGVDIRIRVLFLLMFVYLWSELSPINSLSEMTGVNVNPLIFVFYSDGIVKKIILLAGVIFLFADVPFFDESQLYVMIRCKRTNWVLGKVLYIIMASGLYFVYLEVVSVFVLIRNAYISFGDWGKVVNTLARTNAGASIQLQFGISDKIITNYTPQTALVTSFMLNWGIGIFIGLLMFIISMKFNRTAGMLVASMLVFFDLLVLNNLPYKWFYVSPVTLSRLGTLDPKGITTFPTLTYAAFFFIGAAFIMTIVLVFQIKNTVVEKRIV
ncbi:MAG: hypothetical protein K6G65_10890 [Lachnospiraceae bacterium]|nr:hypothetical protein [Lachnospiraceae bacterium]